MKLVKTCAPEEYKYIVTGHPKSVNSVTVYMHSEYLPHAFANLHTSLDFTLIYCRKNIISNLMTLKITM
jgi:hypothetical protein